MVWFFNRKYQAIKRSSTTGVGTTLTDCNEDNNNGVLLKCAYDMNLRGTIYYGAMSQTGSKRVQATIGPN